MYKLHVLGLLAALFFALSITYATRGSALATYGYGSEALERRVFMLTTAITGIVAGMLKKVLAVFNHNSLEARYA